MKILHANTHECVGGAAVAARRLHLGLLEADVDSRIAVGAKQGDTPASILVGGKLSRRVIRPFISRLEQKLLDLCYTRPEHPSYVTFSVLPSLQHTKLNTIPKDILHLHWAGEGFLSPWALGRLHGPVVWTMHDTWAFTGGCHYPAPGCEKYKDSCGSCPELCSRREQDLSRWHWILKRKAIERLRPVIVSPSKDYAHKAAQSGLLADCRIENIPNGIDAAVFRPISKTKAREILGLPQETFIILFGAAGGAIDHNKGFDLLQNALHSLPPNVQQSFLAVIFGTSHVNTGLPCPIHFLGRLHDDVSLALTYSAADIFVCPSRQDNLPNTAMEALACGTPVVGFSVGGIPDMVEHGVSGYLAAPHDPRDLAKGISLLLGDAELRQRMGEVGREKVEREFSMPVIIKRHISLYEEILELHSKRGIANDKNA